MGALAEAERQSAHGRPRSCAPVSHGHAALALYTEGSARMEQRGEWRLAAGDVLIVPAGEPHRRIEARKAVYWGLSLCAPCVAGAGAAELLEPFERARAGSAPVAHLPSERQQFVLDLLQELERTRRGGAATDATEAVQRSLLTLILNEVERALGPSMPRPARSVAANSLRFIERNCLRRLTLNDVAAAVGRSPAYVTTELTRATGRSAGAWIISGRMAEARRLLAHSDELVEVIAERVGYADPTHFIRLFRREHGATPAAWRARRLGG